MAFLFFFFFFFLNYFRRLNFNSSHIDFSANCEKCHVHQIFPFFFIFWAFPKVIKRLGTLGKNLSRRQFIFPRKQVLTFHANCQRQFAWNVKTCFLRKIRKYHGLVICWISPESGKGWNGNRVCHVLTYHPGQVIWLVNCTLWIDRLFAADKTVVFCRITLEVSSLHQH